MAYLPWYTCGAFLCLLVFARVSTNYYIKQRQEQILSVGIQSGLIPTLPPGLCPGWVSSLYSLSFLGLILAGLWSFAIAWWGPVLPIAAYLIQMALIPSRMLPVIHEAQVQLARSAVWEAAREMDNTRLFMESVEQGGLSQEDIEAAFKKLTESTERAKSLIDAVTDPSMKLGLAMLLKNRAEQFEEAVDGLGKDPVRQV